MGQTLSEPVKDKHTSQEGDARTSYGASSMQGWRISMEDAHTTILRLPNRAPPPPKFGGGRPDAHDDDDPQMGSRETPTRPRRDIYSNSPPTEPRQAPASGAPTPTSSTSTDPTAPSPVQDAPDSVTTAQAAAESAAARTPALFDPSLQIAFYAVYDGHGGASVAQYAGKRLHWMIAQTEEFKRGDYETALKKGYMAIDEELRADPDFQNDPSGCTAVSLLIAPDDCVYVANAGDSRCVLSRGGEAVAMSEDHKPGNPDESARISRAGGFVEFGRVNGNLALSRALGDFEFKGNTSLRPEEQAVTASPDVLKSPPDARDEFLVLACDGIWDVLDNQQVVDFVSRTVGEGKALGKVCEELMDRCLAPDRRASEMGGIGCDNMTVVVVALLRGKTVEEWTAGIKNRWAAHVAELGHDPTMVVPAAFAHLQPHDSDSDEEHDRDMPGGVPGLAGLGIQMTEGGEFVLQTPNGPVVFRTAGAGAGAWNGMEVDEDEEGMHDHGDGHYHGAHGGHSHMHDHGDGNFHSSHDQPRGYFYGTNAEEAGRGRFEEVDDDAGRAGGKGAGGDNEPYGTSGSD